MTTSRTLHAQLHLLDRQVIHADDGRMVCKVDDLELALDDAGRPYVTAILAGPLALGPRIGGVVGRLVTSTTELFRPEEDPGPQRISMRLVSAIAGAVTVGGDPQEAALEHWARRNLIAPLPGSGPDSGTGSGSGTGGGTDGGSPQRRRPARLADQPDALRMGEIIGRRVVDAAGAAVGQVADVRLSQDGPMLDETGHALAVAGLIVVPRHTGRLFGYERRDKGPALVRSVIRLLHRGSRYATWAQVDTLAAEIRLAVPAADLSPLDDMY
jgi:sporulation protein YlmC with PRC-barrel domain